MPSWRRVIISGSDAALNSLFVSNGITGSLEGTSSYALVAETLNGSGSDAFVTTDATTQNITGEKGFMNGLSVGEYGVSDGQIVFKEFVAGNKISIETNASGNLTVSNITGSVLATFYQNGTGLGLSTGKFLGTASFADTASVAISASYAPSTPAFPYTG